MEGPKELVEFGKKLIATGLVVGPGGNTSVRAGEIAYVSPTGFSLADATEEDYAAVNIETSEVISGERRPTCEVEMHLECYRKRPDISAVIHAHPPITIGLISGGQPIRPMTPDFVAYLPRVAVIDYVVPAGQELADAVSAVIGANDCLQMINHGAITVGANLKEALNRMLILEDAARCQMAALVAGKPNFLTPEQIDEITNLRAEDYRRKLIKEGKV